MGYFSLLDNICMMIPECHRVGKDLLLVDNSDALNVVSMLGKEPIKLGMTMAVILEEGSSEFKVNMKHFHIKAPAVLIVYRDYIYQLLSGSENIRCKIILMSRSFTDSLAVNMGELFPLLSSFLNEPIAISTDDIDVYALYYNLILDITSSPLNNYRLEAARYLTLSMFYGYSHLRHNLAEKTVSTNRKNEIYSSFLELLGENYKRERSITFYAGLLCITPKYLASIVKELSGRKPSEIIDEYVVTECKALLLSTHMTIQQISEELNFVSQSVFGKFFKRIVGLSPGEYRRQR